MPQFPTNIDLATLDGTTGFKLGGAGHSVASAGDVNGDGFDDVIVGDVVTGASYVVFGRASGFAADLDLASLDGTNGFKLSGDYEDQTGVSVAGGGDVNGDGFADLVIGAPFGGPQYSGATYVVFGKASGFAANINLLPVDSTNGFRIIGARGSVALGDVNGDGFADVMVGNTSGTTHVMFGKASRFAPTINVSSLDGTNGFKLTGTALDAGVRDSVASAGDVNGDGFGDLLIGTPGADSHGFYSGASYVVFGKASGFAANADLSSLNGTNGFKLSGVGIGDHSGQSVASAGDVNGDGFADLIIGAGAGYVVFGKASGFAANIDLSGLDGDNGFKLSGAGAWSVGSAGDFNGDGFDDVIVGQPYAGSFGVPNSGASYVVFGKASGFDADIDLLDLDGNDGFKLSGLEADGQSGWSVAAAGDVNGDRFDDLIVGNDSSGSRASYIVFGHAASAPRNLVGTDGPDTLTGGAADDTLRGGGGNDTLTGGAGFDKLYGNDGNDTLVTGAAIDLLAGEVAGEIYDGGAGTDTLQFLGTVASVDLSGLIIKSVENLSGFAAGVSMTRPELVGFTGTVDTGAITLTTVGLIDVSAAGIRSQVLNLAGTGNTLLTFADSAAVAHIVNGGGGWDTITATGGGLGVSLFGNAGNDKLTGGAAGDTLNGGADKDRLDGGAGADAMTGGADNDVYVVDSAGDVVTENPGEGVDTVKTTLSSYTLGANVEKLVYTGSGDFTGIGNELSNYLTGGAGNDTLSGGGNNDTLVGGAGNDTLTGGAARDKFLFDAPLDAATNVDQVTDFSVAGDSIRLSQAIFTQLAAGFLPADAFFIGSSALDANDRIIYNSATGALTYDSDGSGGAAATAFATLSPGLGLASTNFSVV